MTEFRAFDHRRYADWPEYRDVVQAVDAFARRVNREDDDATQLEFERVLADVARHLCASDCCDQCMNERDDYRSWAPLASAKRNGQCAGHYACDHGHAWRCWHADRESAVQMG